MKAPMTKQRRVIKLKRKPLNEMKVSFPSYSENERFARVAVSGFLTQLDPQIDELADVKTAVSEGVTNAIVHGYRNTLGEIFMQIRIFENRHVYIKIRDKGCGHSHILLFSEHLFDVCFVVVSLLVTSTGALKQAVIPLGIKQPLFIKTV